METQTRGSWERGLESAARESSATKESPAAKETEETEGRWPDGVALDLRRSRWDGVLTPAEVAFCRRHGIPLAYDCAQIGWIPLTSPDAFDEDPRIPEGRRNPSPASTPGQELARLRRRFRREMAEERASLEAGEGRQGAVARRRLAARAAEEVGALAASHGVRLADRGHWALQVTLRDAGDRESRTGVARPGSGASEDFAFRPWSGEDIPAYLELLRNPRVWEYLPEPYPDPFTAETARALIEVGSFQFHHEAVCVERKGVPVGQCLLRFDPEAGGVRAAEVAYWLGEQHWGKGYMSRILPLFTRRSFRVHGPDVVYAWIRADHPASIRVAERAGYRRDDFPLEAELAEALGRPRFIRYAVYRSEWTG